MNLRRFTNLLKISPNLYGATHVSCSSVRVSPVFRRVRLPLASADAPDLFTGQPGASLSNFGLRTPATETDRFSIRTPYLLRCRFEREYTVLSGQSHPHIYHASPCYPGCPAGNHTALDMIHTNKSKADGPHSCHYLQLLIDGAIGKKEEPGKPAPSSRSFQVDEFLQLHNTMARIFPGRPRLSAILLFLIYSLGLGAMQSDSPGANDSSNSHSRT